ncbi:MAG: hypothetical protein A2Y17_09275 [Clostridiales bacterium GWF2_38_85]|nr:MAG: hypothetical protein A2Y17_09275 [Clostridiales bacterium GWF2_38_85]HBL83611.1 hypothetical protein [Clostridiales bacterium]
MKRNLSKIFLVSLCLLMLIGTIPVAAKVPYTTYTYNVSMQAVESPDAYVPETVISTSSLIKSLNAEGNENTKIRYPDLATTLNLTTISDVFVDDLNWVYIVNKGANQILVCDERYNLKYVISEFINDQGVPDSLDGPSGVFISETEIYVADTENARIVIFDKVGSFKDIIPEPASEVFPDNSVYKPIALAIDNAGRVYVVSSTTNYGVISLNRDGSFNGFLGAQKVTPNMWQYFWRIFQTPEQIAKQIKWVPTEYNNITIDDGGFIYVTTSSIDEGSQQAAIWSKSRSDKYAPVKKLNPNGSDVMRRTGFWPPSGEVLVNWGTESNTGASRIVDVALGPNGMWSIIDSKRQKIYTYDQDGKMLFIFGDYGMQVGDIQQIKAIDYQGSNIIAVDTTANLLMVYKRTEYGDLIGEALQNTLENKHQNAVSYYINILQRNNNFAQAYVGVGKSKLMSGEYEQAMKYFQYASDKENYSLAFAEARKIWIEKYVFIVPLAIIIIAFLINKFFKYANKINKKGQVMKAKRTLLEEYLYGFHIIFHPFDGFWDLKHEKRGSVKGATLMLFLTVLAFLYQSIGRGYLFDSNSTNVNYFIAITSVAMPVMLWVTANWCLTTLFDGEGSYKDVYVTTCYALTPLPMLIVPMAFIANFVTLTEADLVNMVVQLAFVWTGFLIFFGMMVIHDYSLFKNIVTSLGSIVGMAFIMFVAALFSSLLMKIFSFGYNIYIELSLRM